MVNPMELSGRRILVTGASSGIGRETAVLLSKLGANVILIARDEERLRETFNMLGEGEHSYIKFDITELDKISGLMDAVCPNNKKIDGFVHSAGICPVIPVQGINQQNMTEIMTINYFSFMEIVKYYSKKKYSNGGSIVAISSVSSFAGWKGASLYCGTKGALDSSIRALALELYSKGIRVNSVVPSNIKTKMFDDLARLSGEESVEGIVAKQPLGLGGPIDVANAVAFLLSGAARFITGTALVVDGGYLSQ